MVAVTELVAWALVGVLLLVVVAQRSQLLELRRRRVRRERVWFDPTWATKPTNRSDTEATRP